MGALIFCLFPMTAGFAIGFVTRGAKAAGVSALIALLGSLLLLIAAGKEGPLCALMAFVFLAVTIGLGALLGVAARTMVKPGRSQNTTFGIFILVPPAFLFFPNQLKKPLLNRPRLQPVLNTI